MIFYLFLRDVYQAWKDKRRTKYWEKRHLEWLKLKLREDARWLSVDPVGREIAERHEKMASEDWYKQSHEDISDFRRRIKMDPHLKKE